MSKQTKMIVREVRAASAAPSLRKTVQIVSKKRGPVRNRRGNGNSLKNNDPAFLAYYSTVADPWENQPVRLGFLSLVDTLLGSAFVRGSFTVNADGSFGLICSPQVQNFIAINTSGYNTFTWTYVQAGNATGIRNNLSAARVISAGLRAFALFPDTSAPGVLFAGSLVGHSVTDIPNWCPATLAGHPAAELGIGTRGARVVSLPIDVQALQFQQTIVNTTGFNTSVANNTFPFISGTGFPVGTVIWYEAVLNLEGIPAVGTASLGIDVDNAPPLLNRVTNSFENVVSQVRRLVGNAAVMEGAAGLASIAGYPGLSRGLSAFGQGTHMRRQQQILASGNNIANQARQNTLIIEEMTEQKERS